MCKQWTAGCSSSPLQPKKQAGGGNVAKSTIHSHQSVTVTNVCGLIYFFAGDLE